MFSGFGDLLQEETGESSAKKAKKTKSKEKLLRIRPAGVSAEAFKLMNCGIISASNSEELVNSIIPSVSSEYKTPKVQIGLTRPHKYRWRPFINPGRSDNLQLFHWEREDRKKDVYSFAKWNQKLEIERYSAEEYESFFKTAKWSQAETDHLFDLCERFDLRWSIIHDRFDQTLAVTPRSIEDLKERFYDITGYLKIKKHDPNAVAYNFDAAHERRRKAQEELLWNKTPEQIDEERRLKENLRQLEAKKNIRQQSARQLQAYMDSLMQPDPMFIAPSPANTSTSSRSARKSTSRKSIKAVKTVVPKLSKEAAMKAFRIPAHKAGGPHLRSAENYELRKLSKEKDIAAIFKYYNFNEFLNFPASEELVSKYNDIRLGVVCLGDLKKALAMAEAEIKRLAEQYPDVADLKQQMFKISPKTLAADEFGGPGQAATSRQLTSLIQLPPSST